jgi:hypothetical protein
MLHRSVVAVLVVLVLAFFASQPVLGEEKGGKTHEGKIVKVGDGKLTMTKKDGTNEHTHKVKADAKITCDGKKCTLEDLKEGYFVKVTTSGDEENTAIKIVAKTKE